jgi:hypothetical protein
VDNRVDFCRMIQKCLLALFVCVSSANAALNITVFPVKVIGQKVDVPLGIKNDLNESVQSVRAVLFLLDNHGTVVAQGTKWLIGGNEAHPGMPSGGTNTFHFVLNLEQRKSVAATNLTAKVTINRVLFEGGRMADVTKDVKIIYQK